MLAIAKILRSNGTDGGVLLGLLDIEASELEIKEPVFIYFDGLPVPFFIQDVQPKGNGKAIVHLNDVDNLQDSEEIVGREIFIEGEAQEQEEDDFTGWTVYDGDRKIGVVDDMEWIPGNPCLCIGEKLIPIHEDLVVSVNEDAKELYLDLPAGLADLQ